MFDDIILFYSIILLSSSKMVLVWFLFDFIPKRTKVERKEIFKKHQKMMKMNTIKLNKYYITKTWKQNNWLQITYDYFI